MTHNRQQGTMIMNIQMSTVNGIRLHMMAVAVILIGSAVTVAAQPSDPPLWNNAEGHLVTTYTYNTAGRQESVIEVRGVLNVDISQVETRRVFDALGRVTEVIENYDVSSNGGDPLDSAPDKNRTTTYLYNASGSDSPSPPPVR